MKRDFLRISSIGMLALVLAASCVTEETRKEDIWTTGPDVRATQERDKATRTAPSTDAEGTGTISWLPSERINVFFGRLGAMYVSDNDKNATTAVFHTADAVNYDSLHEKNIWGLYPYDSAAECDGTAVTTSIPSDQKAVAGTFDTDLFPLLAHSTNTDLAFYNVCGGIKFSLSRDDIYKVTLRGNGGEALAGKVKLSMGTDRLPQAEVLNKETTLVLTPKSGTTFKKDQNYYLICLPASFTQGFEITFYSVTGKKATYKRTDPVTVKRAVFTRKAQIDKAATIWEDNPEMTGGKRSGLYLGITGFNQEIYNYPITRLNDVSIRDFNSFVSGLKMQNGSLLCYGVDQSINRLQDAVFPDDLCAVALVTFTDGLDQGSVMMNSSFSSDEEYLDFIQGRILNERVADHPIRAYSVGLKGSDVSDVNKFRSNLQKLASYGNAYEVNSMSEVNSRLQAIATNVTDISYLYDISLRIPGQSDGTRIRFTFDSVNDAAYSSAYIEGVFHLGDYSLRNVSYHGLTSNTGSVVAGTVDGIFVSYFFEKIKRLSEGSISQSAIKQWRYVESTGKWQINSEFNASQNTNVEVSKQSVAVMLVLDCSSSLSSQFSTMQSHARSFIQALQTASYDPYAVSSVTLNATSKTVTVGASFQLTATVTPTTAKDKSVTWTSSDPTVATVDQDGLVQTIAPGSAAIVVTTTDGGYAATCAVTVNPVLVTSVTLDQTSLTLRKGESATLAATCLPETATFRTVTWSSDQEEIATVDENGVVTAVGVGAATIRATTVDGGGKYATCSVSCWGEPELVDLGLSVKWASWNIGAYTPESYGFYFAWGETEPKTNFSWSNYKWSSDGSSSNMTKYNATDNKTILESDDDAAAFLLGGKWRMPTKEEFAELNNADNCTWSWTTQNGIRGYKVTSKKEGFTDKSIFLPAGGYMNGTSIKSRTSYGYFWTASLNESSLTQAWSAYQYSSTHTTNNQNRYIGATIRPVTSVAVTSIALDPSETTMLAGSYADLNPVFSPRQPVSYTLKWTSSNERVATVTDGKVHALKPGTATITASLTDGSLKATCSVKVETWGETQWVDLGLSVKWATINMGATSPEEHGDYFAWGETEPKTNYSWSTYKWSSGGSSSNMTKYNASDGNTVLDAEDDVATVQLGGRWRMPTKEELDELSNTNNCTWTWTTQNGVSGYKVTSKKEGFTDKSIFLPATGYKSGTSISNSGSYGYFWTSSLYASNTNSSWYLYQYSSNHSVNYFNRSCGLVVRPVADFPLTSLTLNPSSITLKASETKKLTPVFAPRQPLNYDLKWSSSDERVATVTDGMVQAIKGGSATITASLPDGSLKATCSVKVENWGETDVVDLGLSVKWATHNVGTTAPEGYGDYFAWGETTPKNDYSWATYKWSNGGSSSSFSKYNSSDQIVILQTEDDAAAALLGGRWRTPTQAETDELRENCTWSWTTQNGVSGYRITSKKEGFTDKSIFLPAGGSWSGTTLSGKSSSGYFWTSTLKGSGSGSAWRLYLFSSNRYNNTVSRNLGSSVRPVEEIPLTSFALDAKEVTQNIGTSRTFSVTAAPRTPCDIIWTSSNPGVATVSAGKVNAVAPGTTTITASTVGGQNKATCVVTVIQPVTNVTLDRTTIAIKEGSKATLAATITPNNASYQTLKWTSTNEAVVKVDQKGTVTGVSKGKASVWASATDGSGKYAECTVWVCRGEPVATPELVDLGLSVKWASFNLGAITPEGYGDYYAWGEIYGYNEGKEAFDWSSYIWSRGSSSTILKYNATDNKSVLDMEDDVAHVKLGGKWRMPTQAETDELRENCTWSWTTQNGVKGYKVTGKKEGFTDKSIFLPAGGYRSGSSLSNASSVGYFWTSTSGDSNNAWMLYINSSNRNTKTMVRYYGSSVRPVVGIPLTSITLDPTAVVNQGSSITLTPVFTPRKPAEVVWTSSNTSVATVSGGTVRGVSLGTATISVSNVDGSIKASCKVTVVQPVTGVSMVYTKTGLPVRTTRQLVVKITPENAYNKEVTWSSTNETVATVDASGKVTGVAKGSATIRATAKDGSERYATCSVNVYENVAAAAPTAVNMGLSVKWASFNLGATAPEEYGGLYAWGETFGYKDGKTSFSWSNYLWCNGGSSSLTKYNTSTSYGPVDGKTELEEADDVARFKLGGKWRIPTEAEFAELRNLNNCSWTWTTQNGVSGYLVTSKKNGNSIFLPVGGYRNSGSSYDTSTGCFWTSTLSSDNPANAYSLILSSSGIVSEKYARTRGLAIRAVTM